MRAPQNKPKGELFPAGTHNALCYGVVDMGRQKTSWQGVDKLQSKVRIQWEVPALRVEFEKDGQKTEGPKVIGKTYTFSTFKGAKLSEHLTAWGFTDLDNLDFKELLGKSCLLNVAHTTTDGGDEISYIAGVIQMPAGMEIKSQENPMMYYSIQEDSTQIPDNVYPWMVEKIKESKEWQSMSNAAGVMGAVGATQGQADAYADAPPPEDTTDYGDVEVLPESDLPF
jgi:hypothetical protein